MKKRYLYFILLICFLWMGNVYALTNGDFTYNILEDQTIKITKYNGNATMLSIPEKIANQKVTVIGEASFGRNKTLTSVVIPNSVTKIERGAFAEATNISSMTLGSNVDSIYSNAFEQTAITTLHIPASVTFISSVVCYNCPNFASFTVDSKNTKYSALNGVLYNKDQTKLYSYPTAKVSTVFKVPNTVTRIHDNSFVYARQEKIEFSSNLKEIGSYAFYNSSLKNYYDSCKCYKD